MANRIKNLKFDPAFANKPRRGYSHLEYLDSVFSVAEARRIQDFEIYKAKPRTLEVLPEAPKKKKEESNG